MIHSPCFELNNIAFKILRSFEHTYCVPRDLKQIKLSNPHLIDSIFRWTASKHGRENITPTHRITRKGLVVQTLDIKLTFVQVLWWDELMA